MRPESDSPKMLRSEPAIEERRHALMQPKIAPLAAFVAALRTEMGLSREIPDFDPWDGGVDAELLYLLEAPGAKAVQSGFISRNNPDETAKNFFEINIEAGIPRERTVTWNIVPWYIGIETRIRAANKLDAEAGIASLGRLLRLLPKLKATVLVGKKALYAECAIRTFRPELRIFRSPHPSPLFVNNAPKNRGLIVAALSQVATYLQQ